jgi:hypothetical protein
MKSLSHCHFRAQCHVSFVTYGYIIPQIIKKATRAKEPVSSLGKIYRRRLVITGLGRGLQGLCRSQWNFLTQRIPNSSHAPFQQPQPWRMISSKGFLGRSAKFGTKSSGLYDMSTSRFVFGPSSPYIFMLQELKIYCKLFLLFL